MTAWSVAAFVLLLGLAAPAVVLLTSRPADRLVALETGGVIVSLVLLVLAEHFGRSLYFDLALVAALLSFAGGLVFARFLERWL